jgi:hypothetical protein
METREKKRGRTLKGGSLSDIVIQDGTVVKEYSGPHQRGFDKLRKEVRYLRELPESLRPYFAEILSVEDSEERVRYAMPFYRDMPSLTDSALGRKDICRIWEVLRTVLKFSDENLYTVGEAETPEDYVSKTQFERVDGALEALSVQKAVSHLVKDRWVRINGERLENAPAILAQLRQDPAVQELLRPEKLSLFHGNFHTANILSDFVRFLLIDPRGEASGSRDYDTAKMFCHFYMRYDEIHEDNFSFRHDKRSEYQIELTETKLKKRYDFLLKKFLNYESERTSSPDWERKMILLAGLHAISFSAYHARKKEPNAERVSAFYLSGVKLLNDYLKGRGITQRGTIFPYQKARFGAPLKQAV